MRYRQEPMKRQSRAISRSSAWQRRLPAPPGTPSAHCRTRTSQSAPYRGRGLFQHLGPTLRVCREDCARASYRRPPDRPQHHPPSAPAPPPQRKHQPEHKSHSSTLSHPACESRYSVPHGCEWSCRLRGCSAGCAVYVPTFRQIVVPRKSLWFCTSAVEKHRDIGGLHDFVPFEPRRLEEDVVDVPLAHRARRIDQRRPDSIDGPAPPSA